ncbi:MAG: nicotinamidase-related amidase [Candidatus Binatia bacterium]|jgi:nicotinamidase-related amidase
MPDLEEILQARQERIDELHICRPAETALLVIDMQCGFVNEGASLEVAAARDIVPNIRALIDAFRANNAPVIFTEFVYSTDTPNLRGDPFGVEHLPAVEGQPTGFGFPSSNCLIGPNAGAGAESAETIDELKPLPGELVVQSHVYDKFFDTTLDLALRSQDISNLVLTGITTDVCVNSTLIAASTRNYRVTAVKDSCASPWPELHEACFQIWEKKFARVRTADQIVREITAD